MAGRRLAPASDSSRLLQDRWQTSAEFGGDVALVVLDLRGAHSHGGRRRAVDGAEAGHHKVSTDEQGTDVVHTFAVHGNNQGADRVSVREAGVSG